MKTIELKSVKEKVTLGGREMEIDIISTDLLKTAINSPAQGGYSVSDMMLRVKLLALVEDAVKYKNTNIEFEDADFKQLGKLVWNTKWSIVSKTIIEFCQLFPEK